MNVRDWVFVGSIWGVGILLVRAVNYLSSVMYARYEDEAMEELATTIGTSIVAAMEQMQEDEIEEAFALQQNYWCDICEGLVTDPDIECDHYTLDLS